MQDLLKKIQKKPRAYRRKLAYAITAFFGLIACFLWLSITVSNIKDLQNTEELSENFKKELPSLKNKPKKQEINTSTPKNQTKNNSYKDLQEN